MPVLGSAIGPAAADAVKRVSNFRAHIVCCCLLFVLSSMLQRFNCMTASHGMTMTEKEKENTGGCSFFGKSSKPSSSLKPSQIIQPAAS